MGEMISQKHLTRSGTDGLVGAVTWPQPVW